MRLGVGFTPFETRADVILRLGARADDLGLDRVEVAEGWSHDSMILLAELAARTSRIDLGTSVISAWGRTPATIALGAAGLQRCSGGRFSLGIGASSPPLTEGFHGIAWDQPVARLRETLTEVRALLTGDRLPNPAPGARPLRLAVPPEVPVPIGLAALSPASIRLAGELADAWAPFLWARSRLQDGRALLQEGESRALSADFLGLTVVEPNSMALSDILAYVRHLRANDLDTRSFETTLWSRIARMAAMLLVVMLALPFALGPVRSSGQGARIVIGILIGAGYVLMSRTIESSGQIFDVPPWVVGWVPTIALGLLTGLMLARAR